MKTSYYSKSAKDPNAVSIAAKCPVWYTGREYKKLAPSYDLLMKYKEDHDEEFYKEQYQKQVLDKLDPKQVYKELGENAVLLCWENSEKFCHRHLVSDWLMKSLGVKIEEV